MRDWQLAWRLLGREWRAGELWLMAFALVTAVAMTTTLAFIGERLSGAMLYRSAELLGGDLVISSSQPLPASWRDQAQAKQLDTTEAIEFSTMVVADESFKLTSVKVVEAGYPLRGELLIKRQADAPATAVRDIPQPGTLWLDQRALDSLDTAIGHTLAIGAAEFKVAGVIVFEPDRGGGFGSLAPRAMINAADLAATGTLVAGSRASYKLMAAGSASSALREALAPELTDKTSGVGRQ